MHQTVYIRNALVYNDLLNGLHENPPVLFVLVSQLRFQLLDDLCETNLKGNLCRSFDKLFVVFLIEGVSS